MNRRDFMAGSMLVALGVAMGLPSTPEELDKFLSEKKYFHSKLVVGKEDACNVRDFYYNFDIEMSNRLDNALKTFEKDMNLDTQQEFMVALCQDIANSKAEPFKDALWDAPKKSMNGIIGKA